MLAVDLKLVLLFLAFTAALVEVQGTCCYSKKLNGKTYTRIETNSDEVSEYGCDTKDSCIYEEKGSDTGDRYCFKRGGQEVPDCVQKLPPCAKYFAQLELDNSDEIKHKIRTFPYNVADRDDGICVTPKLPGPAFAGVTKGTLFTLGDDLLLFGPANKWESKKLEGDSWKLNNFAAETSSIGFPNKDYARAAGNTAVYAVGGLDQAESDLNTVFKTEDGFNWKKLAFTLAEERATSSAGKFYSCITQSEESGNENLVVFGGRDSGDKSIEVFDLVTETSVTVIADANFATSGTLQLVCHAGWMYVADTNDDLRMMKLKNGAAKEDIMIESYATLATGGQLVVYDNKVGLVGGKLQTEDDNTQFVYFDLEGGKFKEGAEFPAYGFANPGNPLVPLVTK